MTELSVHIPRELAVTAESVISEQQLPLIPADRLRGTIHPDRLPFLAARITDVDNAIEMHEGAIDPHVQYAKDADLAAHASDQELHLHEGAIGNAEVAATAAIAWSKISKAGAVAADVGAMPALGTIDQQAGSSKPTLRTTGAALQIGDRWLDTSERSWYFWNGNYWLSEQIFLISLGWTGSSVATGVGMLAFNPAANLWLIDWRFSALLNGPNDSTNYWTARLERYSEDDAEYSGSVSLSSGWDTRNTGVLISGQERARIFAETFNSHLDVQSLNERLLRVAVYKTGNAGLLKNWAVNLRYRLVKI